MLVLSGPSPGTCPCAQDPLLSQPPAGQGSWLHIPQVRRLWLLERCLTCPMSLHPGIALDGWPKLWAVKRNYAM